MFQPGPKRMKAGGSGPEPVSLHEAFLCLMEMSPISSSWVRNMMEYGESQQSTADLCFSDRPDRGLGLLLFLLVTINHRAEA